MSKALKNGKVNGKYARFEWALAGPADMSRELIKRNPDRAEPLIAHTDLIAACLICNGRVKEGSAFIRSGSNSMKLAHYECLWRVLPTDEAQKLKDEFENKGVNFDKKRNALEKLVRNETSVTTKSKAVEEYEAEELSLVDLNYRMGKMEGELSSEKRMNDELRRQNEKLMDEVSKSNTLCREILMRMFQAGVSMPWEKPTPF